MRPMRKCAASSVATLILLDKDYQRRLHPRKEGKNRQTPILLKKNNRIHHIAVGCGSFYSLIEGSADWNPPVPCHLPPKRSSGFHRGLPPPIRTTCQRCSLSIRPRLLSPYCNHHNPRQSTTPPWNSKVNNHKADDDNESCRINATTMVIHSFNPCRGQWSGTDNPNKFRHSFSPTTEACTLAPTSDRKTIRTDRNRPKNRHFRVQVLEMFSCSGVAHSRNTLGAALLSTVADAGTLFLIWPLFVTPVK
jgi:hypothetical protein